MLNRRNFNKLIPTGFLAAFLDFGSLFGDSTVYDELISIGLTISYSIEPVFGIGELTPHLVFDVKPEVELTLDFKNKTLIYIANNQMWKSIAAYPRDIRTYQRVPPTGWTGNALITHWKLTEDTFYLILELNDRKTICKLDGLKLMSTEIKCQKKLTKCWIG